MNTKKILHLLSRDARLLSKSLVVLVLILSVCNPASMAVADSNNADKNPTFPGLTQPILPFEGF